QSTSNTSQVGVGDPRSVGAQLGAARPNPSRGASAIELTLGAPTFVRAEVLDITGRRVATLSSGVLPAGVHELSWTAPRARGDPPARAGCLPRGPTPQFEKPQRVVGLR